MRPYLLALAMVFAAACGEDEPPPAPQNAPRPAAPKAAAGAPAKKGVVKDLKPMLRIEDRVTCPVPSDAKKCEPKAPLCDAGQYCIPAGKDYYCGPCPERDAIRHAFKTRDFQGELRDPFQSFVIVQPGLMTKPDGGPITTPTCTRKDQFVASNTNYQSLRIIGIVAQGTQRKVLLADNRLSYIVKKGDCVGKERAVVKDIGAGYITFAVEADGKPDQPAEFSMQLYPTQVSLGAPEAIDPGAASAPLVAPPGGVPPPAPAPAPQQPPQPQGTTTTIIQDKQPAPQNVPPPPAPVQLKP